VTGQPYKTGDKHPEHNQLAFVRYDELGREEWTSIFRDPTAPCRLARESELIEPGHTHSPSRNDHNESETQGGARQ
jgi:hypothetical protein